jgi:hypothetical protein
VLLQHSQHALPLQFDKHELCVCDETVVVEYVRRHIMMRRKNEGALLLIEVFMLLFVLYC